MQKIKNNLQNIIPNWTPESPETLEELMLMDYDSLNEQAKALRSLAVDLVHSHEREPIYTASKARDMLQKNHLPNRKNKWVFIALNDKRDRYYVRKANGLRLVHYIANSIPTFETLKQHAPLPENGSYLFIFGGSPELINKESELNAWRKMVSETTVSDVIFWDNKSEGATFWSLGAGVGQYGNQIIEFDNSIKLNDWRLANG